MHNGLEGLLRVSLKEALRGLFTGVAVRSTANSHNSVIACPVIPACPPWTVDLPACPACAVDCRCPGIVDLQVLCSTPWFERLLWVGLVIAAWFTGRFWVASAQAPIEEVPRLYKSGTDENIFESPVGRADVQKKLRALVQ